MPSRSEPSPENTAVRAVVADASGVSSTARLDSKSERAFLVVLGILLLVLIGLCFWIAEGEFFKTDDFIFLMRAQDPDWSWAQAFFPRDSSAYWNFRPIGIASYFRIGWLCFGYAPVGYFQVTLLCHFAVALLTYRFARQLCISVPLAASAALLSVSRAPSMLVVWFGSGFSNVIAQLLVVASLSLYLDWIDKGDRKWLVSSLLLFLGALLSHESAAMLPLVLIPLAAMRRGWAPLQKLPARAMGWAGSHALLLVFYLFIRFRFIPVPGNEGIYERNYSPGRILRHYVFQIEELAANPVLFGGALVLVAIVGFSIASRSAGRREVAGWFLPMAFFCASWFAVFLAPMTIIQFPHPRYSLHVEVPACLFVISFLEVAWRRWPISKRPLFLSALALALALSIPWQSIADRKQDRSLDFTWRFLEVIDANYPELPDRVLFVLLHGHAGGARLRDVNRFRSATSKATPLVRSAYFEKQARINFHNVSQEPLRSMLCPECRYLELKRDLSVTPLREERLLKDFLVRGLMSDDPRTSAAATMELVRRMGASALPSLVENCRKRDEPRDVCRKRTYSALIRSGAPDPKALARQLRAGGL